MSKVAHPELGWEVLAHPTGEVLTAEARSPGLHLGLLGVPPGFAPQDAEGWLYDVMGVAHESSAALPSSRPIPSILDHAMTGLLFSHGELWDRPGLSSPCSFAFVEGRAEIGFGWVGHAKVSVWVDGRQREPGWVMLRDDRGHEARAWSIPSHHDVQVRISWSYSADDPTAGGAEVEAAWAAEGSSDPALIPRHQDESEAAQHDSGPAEVLPMPVHHVAHDFPSSVALAPLPREEEVAAQPDVAPVGELIPASDQTEAEIDWAAEYEAEVRRSSPGFSGWLRNVFSRLTGRRPKESEPPAGDPGSPPTSETVAPSAGPSEPAVSADATLVARALPSDAGELHESPLVLADLIPPSPEPETPAFEGSDTPSPIVPHLPESGVRIPPSPEPVDLTTRAMPWTETDDPNAIDLPALEPRVAAAAIAPPPPIAPPPVEVELEIVDVALAEPPDLAGPGVAPPRLEGLQPLAEAAAPPAPWSASGATETLPPAPELEVEGETVPAAAAVAASSAAELAQPRAPVPVAAAGPIVTAPPLRPAWPSPEELARPRAWPGRRHGLWIALVGALFVGGWLVGALQDDERARDAGSRTALGQALRAIGLGGPRFVVQVNSRPPGAWISVDGENLTLRTPSAIEVPPGEHSIGLSFTEYGSATFPVRGRKGERVPLDATLWGALDVFSPSEFGVISVSVDGVSRGLAPLRVDSLTPGVHEVRFSGHDVASWGQTVDIRVGETREILARAVQSPSSGVLQVEATLTDALGTQPLKGAQVWIDGELRGTTPLTVDLPRGPHSVRLVHKGQQAPIQVIDLPGGNQRFAVFELGLDQDVPRLAVEVPARIPRDRPAVLSATVVGLAASEVREMWLHVRMAEGAWRRYAMTVLKSPAGAAGAVPFPAAAFDAQGRARYYVSAHSGQGDEVFTEIRTIAQEPSATGR